MIPEIKTIYDQRPLSRDALERILRIYGMPPAEIMPRICAWWVVDSCTDREKAAGACEGDLALVFPREARLPDAIAGREHKRRITGFAGHLVDTYWSLPKGESNGK